MYIRKCLDCLLLVTRRAQQRRQGRHGEEGVKTACKLKHTHSHTNIQKEKKIEKECSLPPSTPTPTWCSMQHLSGKKTDKSKWTYCRNWPWRSFDSGPPYSHWDTWWRENKTQRGRVKDTEGREGIKQEEREEDKNIKTVREEGEERGGEGGRHKRAKRWGIRNSTIHQLQRKRDDLHTVTSLPSIWHHY